MPQMSTWLEDVVLNGNLRHLPQSSRNTGAGRIVSISVSLFCHLEQAVSTSLLSPKVGLGLYFHLLLHLLLHKDKVEVSGYLVVKVK